MDEDDEIPPWFFEPGDLSPPPCDPDSAVYDQRLLQWLDDLKNASHKEKAEFGEKRLVEKLESLGKIVLFGPGDKGWNQPGADVIVVDSKTGVVEFIDNKLLTGVKNISEADALTEVANFTDARNIEKAMGELETRIPDARLRAIAEKNIRNRGFYKVVAGMGGTAIGVTPKLAKGVHAVMLDKEVLEARLALARASGDLKLVEKLSKVLKAAGAVGTLYSLLLACNTAREKGLEKGAEQFIADQSLIVQAGMMLDDLYTEADAGIRDFFEDAHRNRRLAAFKKEAGTAWVSQAHPEVVKDAKLNHRLTDEDEAVDRIKQAISKRR